MRGSQLCCEIVFYKKKIKKIKNYFFIFLNFFNIVILKIISKNKKYYFNIFKKNHLTNNTSHALKHPLKLMRCIAHSRLKSIIQGNEKPESPIKTHN
jgi:hypothetical protein